MPKLVDLTKLPRKETKAEVFSGKEGLKTVLKDALNFKQHFILGDEGYFQDILPIFFKQFIRECAQRKIKERILCSAKVKNKVQEYDYKFSTTKSQPHDYTLPTTTAIYGNKITIFNWTEPYSAVVIIDKDLAKAYKNYFKILWGMAEK